jgi:Fe-S-cluster-containing hydrogenase component 2
MQEIPILTDPERCAGCLNCQLRCSLRATGRFNPAEARIKVDLTNSGFKYVISFTDECDGCGLCVQFCPYGALSTKEGGQ